MWITHLDVLLCPLPLVNNHLFQDLVGQVHTLNKSTSACVEIWGHIDTYKKLMSPWNNLISLLLWVLCLSLLCHLFLASILKEIGDDMPLMGAWSSISNKSQEAWTGQPYLVRLVRRALRLFKPHLQPHPIQSIPIIMRPKPKYKMKILHLHFECVWIVCRCACACVCVFVCVN